ncbi:MAG: hypothetical protein ACTSW1_09555 [Candidatus Hodarchaeales archaeon]
MKLRANTNTKKLVCPKCGTKQGNSFAYCVNCGAKLITLADNNYKILDRRSHEK